MKNKSPSQSAPQCEQNSNLMLTKGSCVWMPSQVSFQSLLWLSPWRQSECNNIILFHGVCMGWLWNYQERLRWSNDTASMFKFGQLKFKVQILNTWRNLIMSCWYNTVSLCLQTWKILQPDLTLLSPRPQFYSTFWAQHWPMWNVYPKN